MPKFKIREFSSAALSGLRRHWLVASMGSVIVILATFLLLSAVIPQKSTHAETPAESKSAPSAQTPSKSLKKPTPTSTEKKPETKTDEPALEEEQQTVEQTEEYIAYELEEETWREPEQSEPLMEYDTNSEWEQEPPVLQQEEPLETGPTQADIDYVHSQRAYLQNQINLSEAQINEYYADIELQEYWLMIATEYDDTTRATQIQSEISTIQAWAGDEQYYLDMLYADLNTLPDW